MASSGKLPTSWELCKCLAARLSAGERRLTAASQQRRRVVFKVSSFRPTIYKACAIGRVESLSSHLQVACRCNALWPQPEPLGFCLA